MKSPFQALLFTSLVLSIFYSLSSCCKAECLDTALSISFQNYTKAEADTITVTGYKANSNFTIKQDSNTVIKPYSASDTTKSTDFYTVYPGKDYIIRIVSLNKEFRISDYELIEQRCACENKKVPVLKSFKVNGVERRDVYNFNLPR